MLIVAHMKLNIDKQFWWKLLQILEATLYYQGGPIAAFLYPATEERIWTFEKYSYYIHHVLLLLVPIYLHRVYSDEWSKPDNVNNNNEHKSGFLPKRQILQNPLSLDWFLYAYGIYIGATVIIHWISYYTMANINVSLCPQDGIPGNGENYRLHSLYWLMVFQLLSAVIYFGLTKLVSNLSIVLSKLSVDQNEQYSDKKNTRRKLVEKEE